MYKQIREELKNKASKEKAKISQSFFKTGKGQYGEGDVFIGVTVPEQRIIAKRYVSASLKDIEYFLQSPIHEFRFTALVILTEQFQKAKEKDRKEIFNFYIEQKEYINNWDLIDCTTPNIVGAYLFDKDKTLLYDFAQSSSMWERRMSIVATFYFIRKNQYKETLDIAELLLKDKEDLIHKAVGWMLREVGKRDQEVLEMFLKKHYTTMPRTMLRYAIEKFPEEKRKSYLNPKVLKINMREKSFEGKLPKKILKGVEGECKICKKAVQDLLAHNKSKHKI